MDVVTTGPAEQTATTPTRTATDEPRPRRYLILGVVGIALLMASVDQTIVATALGSLQRDLHAQVNWSSWTITIYALGQILAMPLAGRISDQYGRKRVFLSAVALFTAASLGCALVSNIYLLVALRAVQAIGGGAFMPSATGIVSDQFGRDRDRAIGLFTSIFPIGGILGPVLGGVFVTYWSWRGIFLINVPLGVILLVLGLHLLPGSTRRPSARLDLAGVGMLVVGLLGVMVAISNLGSSVQPDQPAFLVPLIAGLASLAVFVHHAAYADAPFIPIRLLRGHGFAIVNLINFASGAATLGFGALIPLYAVDRYDLSTLGAGTLLTARAVGMIAVAGVTAFALRRTGYRWPMAIGFLVMAVGLVLTALPAPGVSPYLWLAISSGVTGIGMGVSIPAGNNAALQLAPDNTAAISGIRGMFRQSGGITGISIIAAISTGSVDPGIAQAWSFVILAGILVLLIPLVTRVPDHRGRW